MRERTFTTMHPIMAPLRPRTWMPVKRGRPSSPNSFAVASPNLSPASPQPASLVRPAWPIEKLDERTLFPSLHVSFQIIGGEKSPHVATLRSWHHWQFVLCPPGRRAAARSRFHQSSRAFAASSRQYIPTRPPNVWPSTTSLSIHTVP